MLELLPDVQNHPDKLGRLKAAELEQIVTEIIEKNGFGVSRAIDGTDLIAFGRRQKLKIRFQHDKCRKVGIQEAREFAASLQDAEGVFRGIFVALGAFTPSASKFLSGIGAQAIDFDALQQWIERTPQNVPAQAMPRAAQVDAYIYELTVENVRCFGSTPQTLSLCNGQGKPAQWTVILGENGSGKTTLLQCLTAFSPITTRDGVVQQRGLSFDVENWSVPFQRIQSGKPKDSIWSLAARLQSSKSLRSAAETQSYIPKLSVTYDGAKRSLAIETRDPEKGIPMTICYAYGASRRMAPPALNERLPNDTTVTLFTEDYPLPNIEEWLLQLDYGATKTSDIKNELKLLRDKVKSVICRLLPDVTSVRFGSPTRKKPTPRIEFKTLDGWLPLNALSLGYRTFISWVVDLAFQMTHRYRNRKDPLSGSALVLVDEIDLHMHPKWQRNVMSYLSKLFPNTQFVVTAHSPIFVHAAADANLIVLRRENEDFVRIDDSPETIRNWRIDQLLTSDLVGITAYPPNLEGFLEERRRLLSKRNLTASDKRKLTDLERKIGPIPVGESAEAIKDRNRLDRTLQILDKHMGGEG